MRASFVILVLLGSILPGAICSYAQSSDAVVTVQPSIMVIPYTREGEDIRTILDDDPDQGIALTTIQSAFDERGFTTIDFRGLLRSMIQQGIFGGDNQSGIKQVIIENSLSDIYVEARLTANRSGAGTAAAVQLNGIESATGAALSNAVCRNPRRFRTTDIGLLAEHALRDCLDNFLNVMNEKFGQIIQDGRSVVVNIQFAADSELTMDAEVNDLGDYLADALEDWFEENAFKNNFRLKGVSETNMLLDDVRIPLKEPGSDRNYRPTRFAREIRRYVTGSLGIECTTDVQGTTILVTQIIQDGRSVVVNIQFAADSELTMDAEVNDLGDYLADALEDWFEENAFKNNFRLKGVSETNMLLDDVRIPLKEPGSDRNYRPTRFAREIRRYVTGSLGIECTTDVQGTTILVTLGNWR